MLTRTIFCLIMGFLYANITLAQGGYITNENGTCRMYTAANAGRRTFKLLSGGCEDNYVSGQAEVQVFQDGNWNANYVGNFTLGSLSGEGSVVYSNNDSYIGTFVNGARDTGKYTFSDGRVYEGSFDLLSGFEIGKGVLTFPNGDVYTGNFFGQMSGEGSYVLKNGIRVEGEFNNEELSSATVYFTDNTSFQGDLMLVNGGFDSSPNTKGILTKADGSIEIGILRNTIFYRTDAILAEEEHETIPASRASSEIMGELTDLVEDYDIYSIINVANDYHNRVHDLDLSTDERNLSYEMTRTDESSEKVYIHRYIIDLYRVENVYFYPSKNMILLKGSSNFIHLYEDIPSNGIENSYIESTDGVIIYTEYGMEEKVGALFCELVSIYNSNVKCL